MKARSFLLAAAALCLVSACDRDAAQTENAAAPTLDAPTPESEPARAFAPASETARAVTGRLTVTLTTRMPSAEEAGAGPTEVLALRAETGLTADAVLESTIAPSASVEGQTVRALMGLPVDASQALVYRVTEEAAPGGGRRLCGERETTRLIVWEPSDPAAADLKILALSGEAPGGAGAVLCAAYAYARADAP